MQAVAFRTCLALLIALLKPEYFQLNFYEFVPRLLQKLLETWSRLDDCLHSEGNSMLAGLVQLEYSEFALPVSKPHS